MTDQLTALDVACWHLEHRERSDYSQRSEFTGTDGGPVEMSAGEAYPGFVPEVPDSFFD
jgi:hypothetical protein